MDNDNELRGLIDGTVKKNPTILEKFINKQIDNIVNSGVLVDFGITPDYLQRHIKQEVISVLMNMTFAEEGIPFIIVPSLRRQNATTEVDPKQRIYDIKSKLQLESISDGELSRIRTTKANFYIITNVICRNYTESTMSGIKRDVNKGVGINLEEFLGITIQFPKMLDNGGILPLLGEWKNDQISKELKKDTIFCMGYQECHKPNVWWFHEDEIRENMSVFMRDLGLIIIK